MDTRADCVCRVAAKDPCAHSAGWPIASAGLRFRVRVSVSVSVSVMFRIRVRVRVSVKVRVTVMGG